MSSISKEVFDQLTLTCTLHEIIIDTNVSFTSIKHDFNIFRKTFRKLCARYFLSQRTKQVWLMSTIKPNNSLWRICQFSLINQTLSFQRHIEIVILVTPFNCRNKNCHLRQNTATPVAIDSFHTAA